MKEYTLKAIVPQGEQPENAVEAVLDANAGVCHSRQMDGWRYVSVAIQATSEVDAVARFFRAAHASLDGPQWHSWAVWRRLAWLRRLRVESYTGSFNVRLDEAGEVDGLIKRAVWLGDFSSGWDDTDRVSPDRLSEDPPDDPWGEEQQLLIDALDRRGNRPF